MSVESMPIPAIRAHTNENSNVHDNADEQERNRHKTRRSFKRFTSKLFGKHKEHTTTQTNTENPPHAPASSSTTSSSSSSSTSSSSSSRHRRTQSSTASSSPSSSSSRQPPARSMSTILPTRRASIQGRKNLMSAALPQSGPDRRRAALALLAELEKYDHLQRRSMLRNLPPLQFHITVERRVNGRVQETDIEVSMDELRTQLQEILRAEQQTRPATPEARPDNGLRRIKSTEPRGVKDVSVFPTHIHDGHALPDEKSTCTICIEEYVKGDEIKSIPCMHFYHSECIDEWLKRSKACPVCNQQVEK